MNDQTEPAKRWQIHVPKDVMHDPRIPGDEKLAYVILKGFVNSKSKDPFPTLGYLRHLSGFSIPRLRKALKGLKQRGLIAYEQRRVAGPGRGTLASNQYVFLDAIRNDSAGSDALSPKSCVRTRPAHTATAYGSCVRTAPEHLKGAGSLEEQNSSSTPPRSSGSLTSSRAPQARSPSPEGSNTNNNTPADAERGVGDVAPLANGAGPAAPVVCRMPKAKAVAGTKPTAKASSRACSQPAPSSTSAAEAKSKDEEEALAEAQSIATHVNDFQRWWKRLYSLFTGDNLALPPDAEANLSAFFGENPSWLAIEAIYILRRALPLTKKHPRPREGFDRWFYCRQIVNSRFGQDRRNSWNIVKAAQEIGYGKRLEEEELQTNVNAYVRELEAIRKES